MSAIDYEAESDKRLNWMDLTGGPAQGGMTMLDYFAGKALEGMLASGKEMQWMNKGYKQSALTTAVYDMAEAMLAERNKRFTPDGVVQGITGRTYG